MLKRYHFVLVAVIAVATSPSLLTAAETDTLLGRIARWQYPGSKINGATMNDVATTNAKGERTIPSLQRRTVMTTKDSVDKVVEYYKTKLKTRTSDGKNGKLSADDTGGRAVTFHSDSENRPVAVHLILVNTDRTSTTLVISRSSTEGQTHIAWTQYEKILLSDNGHKRQGR